MKAAYFSGRGDPRSDLLVVKDVPRPVARQGQVLVRILAASMNPVDWKMIDGTFPILPSKGLVGVDSSGIIEVIPEGTQTTDGSDDEVVANEVVEVDEVDVVVANEAFEE